MVTCCAYGCTSRSGIANREKKLSFFRFPSAKDQERRQAWIRAVRREKWVPTSHSFLCSLHFSADQINLTYSSGPRLRDGAIPNLFSTYPAYLQLTPKEKRKPPSERHKFATQPSYKEPYESTVPECSVKDELISVEEELEHPTSVFLKTEEVWEIEEEFQGEKESQYEEKFQGNKAGENEKEEELEHPAAVFLKTEVECDVQEELQDEEESWNDELFPENQAIKVEDGDSLVPCSESGFLASIKQKIGALFPGAGTSSESLTIGEPYTDLVCDCGELFCTEEAAVAHANTHIGVKRCPTSSKVFSTEGLVVPPLTSNTGVKPYKCEVCKKRFRHEDIFFAHMRVHTGEKTFQCNVCNYYFMERGDLIAHMRSHTEGKIYQCDICKKIFKQKKNLFTHMRVHIGGKNFQCGICSQNFKERGDLIVHVRSHAASKHPVWCAKE